VRLTGVSGGFATGFRTVLHFADADMLPILPSTPGCFRNPLHRFNQLSNLSIVGLYSDYRNLPETKLHFRDVPVLIGIFQPISKYLC
jgi:hypothetical protein